MAAIAKIHLENFKRFERVTFRCGAENIFVGPNNSGKSTLLDALRILYGALRYARGKAPRPLNLGPEGTLMGYAIPVGSLPITLKNIAHNYSGDDAILTFTHSNGTELRIRLNPDDEPVLYITNRFTETKSSRTYFSHFPIDLVIVPTISPFEEEEEIRTAETVQKNRSTRLAARNFRNIWHRAKPDEFNEFAALVAKTWPGIEVKPPEPSSGNIRMFFSENRRDREIYWAGFGFQVWLQVLTHLLRGTCESTIIIDEPDIYLHPDLQRKLLHILQGRYAQYFLATHSTEIINAAQVGSIVNINSPGRSPRRITKDEEYQALFDYLGSADNVEIAKLSRARKIVFVEGQDKSLLRRFASKTGKRSALLQGDTLVLAAGGFSQWRRVSETAWTFKNVLGVEANIFALFDRDYRCDEEIVEHELALGDNGITCRVWRRKEIENYGLHPDAIVRTIQKRCSESGKTIDKGETERDLNTILEDLRPSILSQMLFFRQEYAKKIRDKRHRTDIDRQVLTDFDALWKNPSYRYRVVGGKDFLGAVSRYAQDQHGVNLSFASLMTEIRSSEIDAEMIEVLTQLDDFYAS